MLFPVILMVDRPIYVKNVQKTLRFAQLCHSVLVSNEFLALL